MGGLRGGLVLPRWLVYIFFVVHSILRQKFCCIYYKILLVEASSSKWLQEEEKELSVVYALTAWRIFGVEGLLCRTFPSQRTCPRTPHLREEIGRY